MEMRILVELGCWLLTDPTLRSRWGLETWRDAFEACGSPREWADFTKERRDDSVVLDLRVQYERIAKEVLAQRSGRRRVPVVLPAF